MARFLARIIPNPAEPLATWDEVIPALTAAANKPRTKVCVLLSHLVAAAATRWLGCFAW